MAEFTTKKISCDCNGYEMRKDRVSANGERHFWRCLKRYCSGKAESLIDSKELTQKTPDNHLTAINAMGNFFPNTNYNFCHFHLCKNVYTNILTRGLSTIYVNDVKILFRCLPALAFLSVYDVEIGFQQIVDCFIIKIEIPENISFFVLCHSDSQEVLYYLISTIIIHFNLITYSLYRLSSEELTSYDVTADALTLSLPAQDATFWSRLINSTKMIYLLVLILQIIYYILNTPTSENLMQI